MGRSWSWVMTLRLGWVQRSWVGYSFFIPIVTPCRQVLHPHDVKRCLGTYNRSVSTQSFPHSNLFGHCWRYELWWSSIPTLVTVLCWALYSFRGVPVVVLVEKHTTFCVFWSLYLTIFSLAGESLWEMTSWFDLSWASGEHGVMVMLVQRMLPMAACPWQIKPFM